MSKKPNKKTREAIAEARYNMGAEYGHLHVSVRKPVPMERVGWLVRVDGEWVHYSDADVTELLGDDCDWHRVPCYIRKEGSNK